MVTLIPESSVIRDSTMEESSLAVPQNASYRQRDVHVEIVLVLADDDRSVMFLVNVLLERRRT